MEIGNRIRKIRSQQGRTIQEIAEKCQCSKALLSKIETGKVVPAVATLSKIAKSLGVKISVLMEDGEDGKAAYTSKVFEDSSLLVPTSKGYRIFAFAPQYINKKMQPVLICGRKGEVKPHSVYHDGEEFIYVLEGEVKIHIGNLEYHLRQGESIYFESLNEHGVVPVTEKAEYLDIFVE